MYLRRCHRAKDGKRHAYWALVQSVRTARGPRQKIVAYLGDLDEAGRLGVQQAAEGTGGAPEHPALFAAPPPRYVAVDVAGVTVEGTRQFGGPWLALRLVEKLGLRSQLDRLLPQGREEVPWSIMALVLVICRLCDPSSELRRALGRGNLYVRSSVDSVEKFAGFASSNLQGGRRRAIFFGKFGSVTRGDSSNVYSADRDGEGSICIRAYREVSGYRWIATKRASRLAG